MANENRFKCQACVVSYHNYTCSKNELRKFIRNKHKDASFVIVKEKTQEGKSLHLLIKRPKRSLFDAKRRKDGRFALFDLEDNLASLLKIDISEWDKQLARLTEFDLKPIIYEYEQDHDDKHSKEKKVTVKTSTEKAKLIEAKINMAKFGHNGGVCECQEHIGDPETKASKWCKFCEVCFACCCYVGLCPKYASEDPYERCRTAILMEERKENIEAAKLLKKKEKLKRIADTLALREKVKADLKKEREAAKAPSPTHFKPKKMNPSSSNNEHISRSPSPVRRSEPSVRFEEQKPTKEEQDALDADDAAELREYEASMNLIAKKSKKI